MIEANLAEILMRTIARRRPEGGYTARAPLTIASLADAQEVSSRVR